MKTIEDKLQAAHELGRIVGAAECFADEDVRNTVCGAAHALFDGLLTEAGEDLRTDAAYWKRKYEETLDDSRPCQEYPDRGGESARPKTNFEKITKSPETLARNLMENVYECPHGKCPYDDRHDPSKEDCVRCLTDWLNEEATPDD